MELLIGSKVIRVAQAGPDFLILEKDCDVSADIGIVVLTIDGNISRYDVRLPQGLCSTRIFQPIEVLGQPSEFAAAG
jgi:hypothetical protein